VTPASVWTFTRFHAKFPSTTHVSTPVIDTSRPGPRFAAWFEKSRMPVELRSAA